MRNRIPIIPRGVARVLSLTALLTALPLASLANADPLRGATVEMLVESIRLQTNALIQLSAAVLVGTFVTLARYYLPTRERTEVKLASHWWLFGAIAASGLSVIAGYVIHIYITGYYHEAIVRQSNEACIESTSYFVCDTGGWLHRIAFFQLAFCVAGAFLLTLWYGMLLERVRKARRWSCPDSVDS